jgi:hypothetical protein
VWDVDGVAHADPESIFSGTGTLNVPSEHPNGDANLDEVNLSWTIDLSSGGGGGTTTGATSPDGNRLLYVVHNDAFGFTNGFQNANLQGRKPYTQNPAHEQVLEIIDPTPIFQDHETSGGADRHEQQLVTPFLNNQLNPVNTPTGVYSSGIARFMEFDPDTGEEIGEIIAYFLRFDYNNNDTIDFDPDERRSHFVATTRPFVNGNDYTVTPIGSNGNVDYSELVSSVSSAPPVTPKQVIQEGWVYIPDDNTTLEFAVTGSPEVDVWIADEGGVPSHVYSSDGDLEDSSIEFSTVDKGWHFLNVRLSDEDGTSSWELLTDAGGSSPSTPFEGSTSATAPKYCCEEVESDYELQEGEIDCAAKLPHPNQSLPKSPDSVTARLVEYVGGVDNTGSQSFAENMTITQLSNTGRWRINLDPPHPDGADYSPSVILEEQAATRRAMVFEIEQGTVTTNGFLLTVTNANSATRVVTPWRMAIHGGERKILVGD